ncbi:hypothetical protein TorRG33x02_040670 [Trema orientale]|uniref:Uncharacterized protein n=1 Tax=Trema orientale TaxID=63057 RepID=A0A2P5FRB4_TREOI|nr:hypothetical protein TorRG33x02_040670 [Trema orientale]
MGRATVGAPLRRVTLYTPFDGNLWGITGICGESVYTQILIKRCIDRTLRRDAPIPTINPFFLVRHPFSSLRQASRIPSRAAVASLSRCGYSVWLELISVGGHLSPSFSSRID